jgi:hypothetical protein
MKRKGRMVLAALLVVLTALAIYASRQISATGSPNCCRQMAIALTTLVCWCNCLVL